MKRLIILFLISGSFFASAQKWQQLLLDGEKDFTKIQDAFYEEWDGKKPRRGGYKQFKRWEYKNAPRLLEGNQLTNSAVAYQIRKSEDQRMRALRNRNTTSDWQPLGPYSWVNGTSGYNPGIGRVNCIDVHPDDPEILFVGTPAGGLWKSETGGNSWYTLSEDFPILGVTDFYIAPDNTDKMYVLTGDAYGSNTYSMGVFKSMDGGSTWSNPSNFNPAVNEFNRMYRMIVHPEDSDQLLIAGSSGIWKSTDGANSWTNVYNRPFADIEFKPNDPSIVYATSRNSTAFLRSKDGGETWTVIDSPIAGLGRTAIGVSIANPDYVYILASGLGGVFGGVFKSTDAGLTFEMQSNSPNVFGYSPTGGDEDGQGSYDLAIAVNPEDAEDIYVSGIHIWNSKDGGQTWVGENGHQILNYWVYNENNTSNYVHADNHTLDFLNGDLYAGCDGGIWKTSNLGESWQDLSEGLNNTQLYRLGLDQNDESVVIAGAQDNGSNILLDGQWVHIFGADGMEAAIDHTDGSIVYSTFQNGGLLRYTNQGAGGAYGIAGELSGTGAWITPFMLDPQDNDILYAGYAEVWKYTNSTDSWERLSNFRSTSNVTSLVVSPTNSDYIYASAGFNVFRTTNGGTSWTNISAGLPGEYLTYLAVSENDPSKLWATFSGYSAQQKVYESENGGTTWTNISEGLPNLPVNCIVHQRFSDDQLYVGTDIGVYQRNDATSQWEPWFDGLPNVIVNELEIHYHSQKVVAATYGRGLWSSELIDAPDITNITADITSLVEGNTVSFSADFAKGVDPAYSWAFEGGDPAVSSVASPVITYHEPGLYDVTLNGVTLPELIDVLDLISIKEITSDRQVIDRRQSATFSAEFEGNPSSWDWTFEGGTPRLSSQESPTITYYTPGEYNVTLVLQGDTRDEVSIDGFIRVEDALNVSETNRNTIYPTVTNSEITLKVDQAGTEVEIMSLSGTVLKSIKSNNDITVNIKDLAPGIYLLKVTNDAETKTTRIIRE